MQDDIYEKIEDLKDALEHIFDDECERSGRDLEVLRNSMNDELASAFGGSLSDGGYVLDGDMINESPQNQYKWLKSLRNKYEKMSKEFK